MYVKYRDSQFKIHSERQFFEKIFVTLAYFFILKQKGDKLQAFLIP